MRLNQKTVSSKPLCPLNRSGSTVNLKLEFSHICIDSGSHTVEVMGVPVQFTTYEFEILFLLAYFPERALSAKDIYRLVWQMDDLNSFYTVCVHISNLRKKLKEVCPGHVFITTKWKKGYQFTADHETAEVLPRMER